MITLYYSPQSRATRPRWALEELGVPYDLVTLDLGKGEHKNPDYLKIHPMGFVPAIRDGDLTLMESAAIVAYLADKYPDKKLAPAVNSPDRAVYYQWLFFSATTLEEPIVRFFLHTIRLPLEKRSAAIAAEAREAFNRAAKVVSDHLSNREYMLGSSFTAADILLGSSLSFAKYVNLLGEWPVLEKYVERVTQRPAFRNASA